MINRNLKKIILDFIHKKTGWGNPLVKHSEFEDLQIKIFKQINKNIMVNFSYRFDEDGFSQYDKTHNFNGNILIDSENKIIDGSLVEISKGIAAVKKYNQNEKIYIQKLKKKLGSGWYIYPTNIYENQNINITEKKYEGPIFCIFCGCKELIEIFSIKSGTIAGGSTEWIYRCCKCNKTMTLEHEWG